MEPLKATETKADVDLGVMFLDCQCDIEVLRCYETKLDLDMAIKVSKFTPIGKSQLHVFPGDGSGFTYLACIGESHVAVHTWPEKRRVDINTFYCNDFSGDYRQNKRKAKVLLGGLRVIFKPRKEKGLPTRFWQE